MKRIYQVICKLPFDLAPARAVYIYSCDSIKALNVLNHIKKLIL